MQAETNHTTTPSEAVENIGSVVVELHALTGLLDHLATSTVDVSKDQVGVIANSLAAAVGAIDRTTSDVIQAWKAEKDRATLLLAKNRPPVRRLSSVREAPDEATYHSGIRRHPRTGRAACGD
jgi:hypothetical protein